MSLPVPVSMEGNIGAGKSTLLSVIASAMAAEVSVVPEPIADWTGPAAELNGDAPLDRLYADEAAYGRAFQMYALATKLEAAGHAVEAARFSGSGVLLYERCPLDQDVFPTLNRRRGIFNDFDALAFRRMQDAVGAAMPAAAPRHHIYLRVDPYECARRTEQRGRGSEDGISAERFLELHAIHEAWMASLPAERVLVLDGHAEPESHLPRLAAFFKTIRSPGRG